NERKQFEDKANELQSKVDTANREKSEAATEFNRKLKEEEKKASEAKERETKAKEEKEKAEKRAKQLDEDLRAAKEKAESDKKELQAKVDDLAKKLNDKTTAFNSADQARKAAERERDAAKNELKQAKSDLESANSSTEAEKAEKAKLQEKVNKLTDDLSAKDKAFEQAEKERLAAERERDVVQSELDTARETMNKLGSDLAVATGERDDARGEVARLKAQLGGARVVAKVLENQRDKAQAEVTRLKQELLDAEAGKGVPEADVKKLRDELKTAQDTVTRLADALDLSTDSMEKANGQIDEILSKLGITLDADEKDAVDPGLEGGWFEGKSIDEILDKARKEREELDRKSGVLKDVAKQADLATAMEEKLHLETGETDSLKDRLEAIERKTGLDKVKNKDGKSRGEMTLGERFGALKDLDAQFQKNHGISDDGYGLNGLDKDGFGRGDKDVMTQVRERLGIKDSGDALADITTVEDVLYPGANRSTMTAHDRLTAINEVTRDVKAGELDKLAGLENEHGLDTKDKSLEQRVTQVEEKAGITGDQGGKTLGERITNAKNTLEEKTSREHGEKADKFFEQFGLKDTTGGKSTEDKLSEVEKTVFGDNHETGGKTNADRIAEITKETKDLTADDIAALKKAEDDLKVTGDGKGLRERITQVETEAGITGNQDGKTLAERITNAKNTVEEKQRLKDEQTRQDRERVAEVRDKLGLTDEADEDILAEVGKLEKEIFPGAGHEGMTLQERINTLTEATKELRQGDLEDLITLEDGLELKDQAKGRTLTDRLTAIEIKLFGDKAGEQSGKSWGERINNAVAEHQRDLHTTSTDGTNTDGTDEPKKPVFDAHTLGEGTKETVSEVEKTVFGKDRAGEGKTLDERIADIVKETGDLTSEDIETLKKTEKDLGIDGKGKGLNDRLTAIEDKAGIAKDKRQGKTLSERLTSVAEHTKGGKDKWDPLGENSGLTIADQEKLSRWIAEHDKEANDLLDRAMDLVKEANAKTKEARQKQE
ncbi:hypothetical protein, partial [Streptomyces klenkii]|uniref:hypothetical protein n=1 Tax=Streptomyces klenkii TaxID=1420899 RepID=UPI003490C1FB